jgi:hypothetical protein
MAMGMSICNKNTALMPTKLGGDRGLPVTTPHAIGSDRVTVQQRKRVMMPEKPIVAQHFQQVEP